MFCSSLKNKSQLNDAQNNEALPNIANTVCTQATLVYRDPALFQHFF